MAHDNQQSFLFSSDSSSNSKSPTATPASVPTKNTTVQYEVDHSGHEFNEHESLVAEAAPHFAGSAEDLLEGLNEPQREAVKHFEGPILVLAGAGSGKTRVLTRRVANLVLAHGVRPQNILAVTFTNKATEEMRERLRSLLGAQANELWVATFHSASLRILRRHAPLLGYTNDFVVYDEQDSKGVLKALLKERDIDEKKFPVNLFSRVIDQAKNSFILPEKFAGSSGTKYESQIQAEIYAAYQQQLLRQNAMDFGDLLVNAVRILQNPDVLNLYRRHLHFILVDEYQDTNAVQYQFIQMLAAPRNNLLVVGDDDQSIYAFRGATIRNILEFEKDYKNTKVIKLEQNYRSTGNILKAAHAVIDRNTQRKGKKLWTSEGEGSRIGTYVGLDEADEANFIAQEIVGRTGRSKGLGGISLNNVAIFYRTNAQSRAIEEALISRKIPYKIFGGLKFYDRKEIKDILAYLRLLVNEADNQAFQRVINTPPRGIGAQSLQTIADRAKKDGTSFYSATATLVAQVQSGKAKAVEEFLSLIVHFKEQARKLPLSQLIAIVIEKSGYGPKLAASKEITAQSRIENLKELEALGRGSEVQGVEPFDNLRQFLDRVALTASSDAPTEESGSPDAMKGSVSLMTLHLAKGLEFPLVFLTGVEEGLIPHYRSMDDPIGIEEERRLLYVGVTRARIHLSLSYSQARSADRKGKRAVSRFLTKMWPREEPPRGRWTASTPGNKQKTRTKSGDINAQFLAEADQSTRELFESLRQWRLGVTRESGKPAFTVVADATLRDVATAKPRTLRQLGALRGIGAVKLEAYGTPILRIVKDYLPG